MIRRNIATSLALASALVLLPGVSAAAEALEFQTVARVCDLDEAALKDTFLAVRHSDGMLFLLVVESQSDQKKLREVAASWRGVLNRRPSCDRGLRWTIDPPNSDRPLNPEVIVETLHWLPGARPVPIPDTALPCYSASSRLEPNQLPNRP